jgi:hypothetical protein
MVTNDGQVTIWKVVALACSRRCSCIRAEISRRTSVRRNDSQTRAQTECLHTEKIQCGVICSVRILSCSYDL